MSGTDPDDSSIRRAVERGRLGIFGGTFDPPHVGHVVIAAQAVAALDLDHLVVTVAGDPWQKSDAVVATATDRLALARAAFADIDRVSVSRVEIDRVGPTYTIDTVHSMLAGALPSEPVVLVLGADAARSLPSWHRADELASLVTVAVVGRAGDEPVEVVGFRSIKIDVSRVDVSSSEIRDRIRNGRPVDGLVPPTVIHELRARRLYTR